MTKKEKQEFCYRLASLMCYPDNIEISGLSERLVDILKTFTKGKKQIREEVLYICKDMVVDGHYDSNAYSEYMKETLDMITEDYDKVFFK